MPINNSTLPSREEYLRKKRNKKITKYVIIFFIFVLFVLLFSYLSHRKEVRISRVILKGGLLVKESDVSEKSFEYMSGSYFWLFPKNSSFWYPKNKLEDFLSQNFKRIETISIKLDGFQNMVVTIEERKPFAIWCDSMIKEESVSTTTENMEDGSSPVSKCYFIDKNSTIFSEAPYFSGDAYFKYYGSIGTSTPIGNYYIASSTEFDEINNFINSVEKMSLHPQYLVTKGVGDYSLVISGGGEILFDLKKPLSEVSQNLESLLKTPALSTSTNQDLPIEYIDLRYGNKLFYKLKNE
jgi:cell division septal protein FtsQ